MRQPGTPFWDVYRLFNIKDLRFDGVYWKAAAYQTPKVHPSVLCFSPHDIKPVAYCCYRPADLLC